MNNVPPSLVTVVEVARDEVPCRRPGRRCGRRRVETRQRLGQSEREHLRVETVVQSDEPEQPGHVTFGRTAARQEDRRLDD